MTSLFISVINVNLNVTNDAAVLVINTSFRHGLRCRRMNVTNTTSSQGD